MKDNIDVNEYKTEKTILERAKVKDEENWQYRRSWVHKKTASICIMLGLEEGR